MLTAAEAVITLEGIVLRLEVGIHGICAVAVELDTFGLAEGLYQQTGTEQQQDHRQDKTPAQIKLQYLQIVQQEVAAEENEEKGLVICM